MQVEHYAKNSVPLEIIDVVYDASFLVGNMFKYMVRTGDKGEDDRAKAIDYAKRFVAVMNDDPKLVKQTVKWYCRKSVLLRKFDSLFVAKGYPSLENGRWFIAYIKSISELE